MQGCKKPVLLILVSVFGNQPAHLPDPCFKGDKKTGTVSGHRNHGPHGGRVERRIIAKPGLHVICWRKGLCQGLHQAAPGLGCGGPAGIGKHLARDFFCFFNGLLFGLREFVFHVYPLIP